MYVSVDCGSKPGYRWGGQTQPCRKKASHPIGSKPGLGRGCCEATVITTFHLGYLHIHTLFCTFLRLYSVVELAWAVWLTDAGSLDFLGLTESVCKYTFSCSFARCHSASPAASNPLFCRKIENTVILISLTLSSLRVYSWNASNIPRILVAMESQRCIRYILQKLLCQLAPFTHAQHIQTV